MVSSNMFCDPVQGPIPTLNDTNPCDSNEECISNNCASDYTGSGKWCAPSGDCSHDGVTYSNGATTCDDSTKETCDNGVWNGNVCSNGCSNGDCTTPYSGGGSVGGGTLSVFSGAIKIVAVCGNGICDYNETCSNCPKDCLKDGQVCCKDIPYLGSCCLDVDCEKGYECSLSKECKLIHTATEIEICKEDWVCDNWTDCNNDVQTRVCLDKNSCGTIKDRPELVQKCGGLVPGTLTGLFLFLTSPLGYGTIIAFIMLLLFFWRRLKHVSVQPQ
jgi:hypothetical protein